jgi:hypothetical protein
MTIQLATGTPGRGLGLPRVGGHERCSAYNVGGELLDAVLCERVGEDGGL